MIFTGTELPGLWVLDLDRHEDSRGFFARTWCRREFSERGLEADLAQCSLSRNHSRGTLRGLHWQAAPHAEDKLVRCVRGAIYDVAVDLRRESPTYLRSVAVELGSDTGRALFIPQGCAHGFQSLEDDTDVLYQMSQFHEPSAARGARWNDPAFGIHWPLPDPILHPRDASYPDFV